MTPTVLAARLPGTSSAMSMIPVPRSMSGTAGPLLMSRPSGTLPRPSGMQPEERSGRKRLPPLTWARCLHRPPRSGRTGLPRRGVGPLRMQHTSLANFTAFDEPALSSCSRKRRNTVASYDASFDSERPRTTTTATSCGVPSPPGGAMRCGTKAADAWRKHGSSAWHNTPSCPRCSVAWPPRGSGSSKGVQPPDSAACGCWLGSRHASFR